MPFKSEYTDLKGIAIQKIIPDILRIYFIILLP